MKIRNAVVEGRFYPSSQQQIFGQIGEIETKARYPEPDIEPARIFGAVLPHAGHIYSGHQTVPFFKLLQRMAIHPETFVIVHPNHSGYGVPVAVDDADMWTNSIGQVPVDRAFEDALALPFDSMAHANEHSAEVIVPFLQYYLGEQPFSIVPVCMRDQGHKNAADIADKIVHATAQTGRNIMLLASCDFSHFLSPVEGEKRDQFVLDEILSRNPVGVETAVHRHKASICGYGPIMVLMNYAASFDQAYKVRILARGNSGEVIPSIEVVDYVSMILYQ